jgi:hypothetical protein
VDHDRRSALQFRARGQPNRDRVTGILVVVFLSMIVFGKKVVIEEDRIVEVVIEKAPRLLNQSCLRVSSSNSNTRIGLRLPLSLVRPSFLSTAFMKPI